MDAITDRRDQPTIVEHRGAKAVGDFAGLLDGILDVAREVGGGVGELAVDGLRTAGQGGGAQAQAGQLSRPGGAFRAWRPTNGRSR